MSDEPRLCGICGETPVEPPHVACDPCFQRADWIAKHDPYYWMEGRPKPPGNGSGTSQSIATLSTAIRPTIGS